MKSVPSVPRNAPRADIQAVAAVGVALAAWALYRATLLPGFDFGDTGSLQTTVGSTLNHLLRTDNGECRWPRTKPLPPSVTPP